MTAGHLEHTPGGVPQLKHIAGVRLDGEVLVQRPDERLAGIEHHAIVGNVRNGPARGEREQPRPTASTQRPMHLVSMDERCPATTRRRETVGDHRDHRVERLAGQIAIGPCAPDDLEQRVLLARPARGLRHDLLGEDIERRVVLDDGVELSPADGAEQSRALEQIVTSDRKEPALRNPGNRVTRASDPLEQRCDPMRRANLTDEIHVPDVDAQLQRRGGDERAQGAGLEPTFRVLALFAGEASVMCGDRFFAEPIAQVAREALRHPPGIHEDEGRAVLLNQRRQSVVVLLPDLVRHHRVEERLRYFDAEVELTLVSLVNDCAWIARGAHEKSRDGLDRLLGGRQTQAQQWTLRHVLQPFERQREVRTSASADHGMDLVHDHRANRSQHLAASLGRQEQIQRFRRGDEDVRRRLQHRRPLGRGRVSSSNGRGDGGRSDASLRGEPPDRKARLGEILVDVGAQRLERRNVQHPCFVGQRRAQPLPGQPVERHEKRGERFSRAGWRGNQRVASLPDRLPSADLRTGGHTDFRMKPALHDRMEIGEGHDVGREPG